MFNKQLGVVLILCAVYNVQQASNLDMVIVWHCLL